MVFKHILWMFVCLRLLGSEPAAPSPVLTLCEYAAELEMQYWWIRISAGIAASGQARDFTHDLIRTLGLPQAAEPLPPSLLPLLLHPPATFPTD